MLFKVAIVDDEESVREAIEIALTASRQFLCVGSYRDGAEALQAIPKVKPDLTIMDIRMPRMSGIECTRRLRVVCPKLRIVMYTGHTDVHSVLRALMAGCDGYLAKAEGLPTLTEALLSTLQGGVAFSAEALRGLLRCFYGWRGEQGLRGLSLREEEVFSLLFQRYRHKEIASKLGVSLKTIRTHVYRIQKKLHASGYGGAVRTYLRMQ